MLYERFGDESLCGYCDSEMTNTSYYAPYGSTQVLYPDSECGNPYCPGERIVCPVCREYDDTNGQLEFGKDSWECLDCGREYEPDNLPDPCDEWTEEQWDEEDRRRRKAVA